MFKGPTQKRGADGPPIQFPFLVDHTERPAHL